MDVKKSNNSFEEYSKQKVMDGICEAFKAAGEECQPVVLESIANNLYVYDRIPTSDIRHQVEDALMSINKKVAKSYMSEYEGTRDVRKKNDFITNYIAASNAATGSKFDANANVTSKNIVTMGQELYKENNIKENRFILTNKIKSLYSKKLAKQYIKDIESHLLYKHDETAVPGMPYTYSAKETVEVKYKGRHLFLPFDLLWEVIEEETVLVNKTDGVWQKYPKELYVKDKGNAFTTVTVMTKKNRLRDLVRVKTASGEDVVVTDNHPMIVNVNDIDNTVEAIKSEGQRQYRIGEALEFDNRDSFDMKAYPETAEATDVYCITTSGQAFKRHLAVNEALGYFVGYFVANGEYGCFGFDKTVSITSNRRTDLLTLNNILFNAFGIVGKIEYCGGECARFYRLSIKSDVLIWLLSDYFRICNGGYEKTLPYNVLEFNGAFAKGILSGLSDAYGMSSDGSIFIALRSRAAVMQTTALLRHFGYGVDNTVQTIPSYNTYGINIWGVKTVNTNRTDGETTITSVTRITDDESFLGENNYIYDITTGTRTFALNNILVHNCVAINMYPFLMDGLTKLGGPSKAPTDTRSYCGEFINLIYSISSQFAGAVASAEFLLYMDYFLAKDYGEDYPSRVDEVVELTSKKRTLGKVIDNYFQQVVHSMNMPAGNRG